MDVHGPPVASLSSRSIWSGRSVSFIVSLHEALYFGVDFLDEVVGVDHVIVFAVHVVESGDNFLGFTKRTFRSALFRLLTYLGDCDVEVKSHPVMMLLVERVRFC